MLNILLGLVPEAIFFSSFIIFTKNYKHKVKNVVFTLLMIAGYIVLKQLLPRNVYCQIIYLAYVPLLMFLLYREKFHISDVFVMSWSSAFLLIFSIIAMLIPLILGMEYYILAYIINRAMMFLFLILAHKKLNEFYKYIIPQWNRNRKEPNKIKALTIRNICVISLNLIIFIANFCMIFVSNHNIIK